ncbi:MAG: PepSY-like domain-containing protein [Muribaculaceae bacterium]|nr:PepSY-like domain-containing protein [Muribaculaceae bacterium]MDE6532050.1 PepSY-like domain-containing protein [Muribaculaceae bacterium]
MRKKISLMLVAFMASFSAVAYAGTTINQSELPKAATAFLSKYFPGDNIRKAEKDQGRRGMEYEVDLASGAEIDFMSDGNWKEVKAAKGKAVPSAIVPSAIAKYVDSNFSGLFITEIARKRGGYEVELSNGTELKLTEDAKPMPAREGGRNGGPRGNR